MTPQRAAITTTVPLNTNYQAHKERLSWFCYASQHPRTPANLSHYFTSLCHGQFINASRPTRVRLCQAPHHRRN